MGDELFSPKVTHYLDELLPARDEVASEMESYAAEHGFPIVGPQVGHLLCVLARIHAPVEVFEMGSGFGYSAYWFLKGAPDATIVCTETDAENIERGRQWMARAGCLERMDWRHGDARIALRESGRAFDLIFNDIDKEDYPEAFELALEHLPRGGMLVTDNLLWSGRVADPDQTEASTEGVRAYNHLMFNTPGVTSSLVPIRDGVGVSVKQ